MKLTCFWNDFACLRKDYTHLRLRKHLFTQTKIWRKRKKKWYDSAENAATETWKRVCVKFPFTETWYFVLRQLLNNKERFYQDGIDFRDSL